MLQWGRKQNACGIRNAAVLPTTCTPASMGPQTKRLRNRYLFLLFLYFTHCGFNGAANKTLAEYKFVTFSRVTPSSCFNGAANKTLAESSTDRMDSDRMDSLQWGRKQNACGMLVNIYDGVEQ